MAGAGASTSCTVVAATEAAACSGDPPQAGEADTAASQGCCVVAVGGPGWVERFDRALARAAQVTEATDDGHLGDDALYEYAAKLIEGLALLRADRLQATPTRRSTRACVPT